VQQLLSPGVRGREGGREGQAGKREHVQTRHGERRNAVCVGVR